MDVGSLSLVTLTDDEVVIVNSTVHYDGAHGRYIGELVDTDSTGILLVLRSDEDGDSGVLFTAGNDLVLVTHPHAEPDPDGGSS